MRGRAHQPRPAHPVHRAVGQRQEHAGALACRYLALRAQHRARARAIGPHAVPAAKAVSAAGHAQAGAHLSAKPGRLQCRANQRGTATRPCALSGSRAGADGYLDATPLARRAAAPGGGPRPTHRPGLAVHGRGHQRARCTDRTRHVRAFAAASARRHAGQCGAPCGRDRISCADLRGRGRPLGRRPGAHGKTRCRAGAKGSAGRRGCTGGASLRIVMRR